MGTSQKIAGVLDGRKIMEEQTATEELKDKCIIPSFNLNRDFDWREFQDKENVEYEGVFNKTGLIENFHRNLCQEVEELSRGEHRENEILYRGEYRDGAEVFEEAKQVIGNLRRNAEA